MEKLVTALEGAATKFEGLAEALDSYSKRPLGIKSLGVLADSCRREAAYCRKVLGRND